MDAAEAATYIVVCRGPNCRERGGLGLRKRLAHQVKGESGVRLVGYACFGQCDFGPNVAFYPEGTWYGRLVEESDADRVVKHASRGQALPGVPLALPEAERRDHLKNIADLVDTLERDRARKRPWWWPGFLFVLLLGL